MQKSNVTSFLRVALKKLARKLVRKQVKRLLLRGYGEIPIKINPIGEQDAKRQYC